MRLDDRTWEELESTFCGAGEEENWQSLWNTIVLFRRGAKEVGEKMGFDYPQDMDERTVRYLESVEERYYKK